MDNKLCKNCVYYRWIDDTYDDGSYIATEYCDDDPYRYCIYDQPACEHFKDSYKGE